MAKREKKTEPAAEKKDLDTLKLSKELIKDFNKDEKNKIAWCLATDDDNPTDVKEFLSTGSTLLDYIITNRKDGGVPVGKLTEISGEEASGKSLICAELIAECQRRGGIAIYIDTENAANPEFMAQIGVNLKELVYLQPGTCEEVGEAIEKTILHARNKAPNRLVLIIWDSVAGTPTKVELEGTYDLNMNIQLEKSKVLSKMMTRLTQIWGKERICMVFTNQLKTKIGVMHGDPMTTPGGKAIPYHASVRIRLVRSNQVKADAKGRIVEEGGEETVGIRTYAKVIKGRFGPPLRKVEFNIMFANGIDDEGSWFTYLREMGDIEKADGWCYVNSYPSGKLETKGVWEGKDRGAKFRAGDWKNLLTDDHFREHILGLLDKHLVKKYGEIVDDAELDPESLMETEAVVDQVLNGATNELGNGSEAPPPVEASVA